MSSSNSTKTLRFYPTDSENMQRSTVKVLEIMLSHIQYKNAYRPRVMTLHGHPLKSSGNREGWKKTGPLTFIFSHPFPCTSRCMAPHYVCVCVCILKKKKTRDTEGISVFEELLLNVLTLDHYLCLCARTILGQSISLHACAPRQSV